ncbi:hypothetical protein BSL78_05394 [Apostichopus japonicus]|uniref:Uncharacterized protein n=1 Tax=Stichopus japonicus TaxID=307972 RepID=A0A2G8LC29_STIJA|nr:hypothetical protein BSL78_05394 [Apostichopus japonicus]
MIDPVFFLPRCRLWFLIPTAVLCLREQAPDHFASLIPLATLGGYVGIVLLPGIVEVFLENYGLHGAFCLYGALTCNTIPCGLLLIGGKGKQYENLSNSIGKSEPSQEVEAFDEDIHNFTNLKYGMLPLMKYFRFFASVLKENLSLFLDLTFTLFFITANTRRFSSDNWTLFLIPYNQELGMTKTNAVIISAFGGIGGKSYDVFGSFAVMFEVDALINAVSCVLVVVIIVLRKLNYKNTIQN